MDTRSTQPAAYAELSDEDQARALRPVAVTAAAQFGLVVGAVEILAHAYNTTFRVDTTDGKRVALRLNTNSLSTVPEIVAQQAWQLAITAETPVRVPVPRTTGDGSWCAGVWSEALGREVLVTCASWLDGPDVGNPSPEVAHALGRAMALLHEHARGWRLPAGGRMPLFDGPFLGDEDLLGTATWLSAEQHEVLDRAREATQAAFRRVYAGAPVIPLHADLHGANLKWHEGRLAIFDFDDCGLGVPALDLAVSAFYLRGGDEAPEQAMLQGYAEVAPLPEIDAADYEALVASRQLLMANAMLTSSTAAWREAAEGYLVRSADRLRRWLDTGRFTRVLPAG